MVEDAQQQVEEQRLSCVATIGDQKLRVKALVANRRCPKDAMGRRRSNAATL